MRFEGPNTSLRLYRRIPSPEGISLIRLAGGGLSYLPRQLKSSFTQECRNRFAGQSGWFVSESRPLAGVGLTRRAEMELSNEKIFGGLHRNHYFSVR